MKAKRLKVSLTVVKTHKKPNMLGEILAKRLVKPFHRTFVWNRRIHMLSYHILRLLPERETLRGLDVGCGIGSIAKNIMQSRPHIDILGADVLIRKDAVIDIIQIIGDKLPFKDKSFDFIMLIDVLHHAIEPLALMKECVRVSRKFILLKDHFCESRWDNLLLLLMDWIGNRAFSINLPYSFLSRDDWEELYKESKVKRETLIPALNLYPQPFSYIFDSTLQFLAKLVIINL